MYMENLRLSAKQYIIAITVGIACFLPPFIGEATNIVLPEMLNSFGLTAADGGYWNLYGWILTVYLLTSTVFLIPAARLSDKFNKKWFFCIGVLLLGVGSLGVGLSTSGEMVLAMRTIEGIGNALMFGTAIALLASAVKVELRGTAIGVAMTGVFMGQLLGPLLAGTLTEIFGWSTVYLILCPIALISFFLAIPFIPKDVPTDKGRFDWIGALLFMFGMGSALYGFSQLPKTVSFGPLVAGIVFLIIFYLYEKKNTNPIVPIDLILHNRGFTFNNSANLLYYIAIYAMGSLVSLYMSELWGIDPLPRALIITTQGLILVLFTIVAGKFYDHLLPRWLLAIGAVLTIIGIAGIFLMGQASADPVWLIGAVLLGSIAAFGIGSLILTGIDRLIKNAPPKYATTTGLIIIALGMIVLLTCNVETAIWSMIAVEAFFGVGIAIFVTPNSTAIMNSVTEQEYGMASGTLSTTRMLGMAVSIGIVSILKNIFLANTTEGTYPAAFLQMLDGFIIAALIVLIIAMILSWTAGSGDNAS